MSCATSIAALSVPAMAQETASVQRADTAGDIIVTARRVEERLQDVPISITVFDQGALDRNNVVSFKDIAAYTPSMTVNTRYGNDASTFTIRGFSQEQRTTPTVGVYFADVVALRGSGGAPGGDGAGPGAFFDLQNVQVLKGPQGTLFGRNTTGGAVLLVPRKPTANLEGYVEGSIGNYDMRRLQGVVNVPVGETFRVRAGVDWMQRDGFLKNISPFGRKDFGNTDYITARFSAVADLSPDVENYTIVSYTKSQGSGTIPAVKGCNLVRAGTPGFFGQQACDQIARQAPSGFWTVENSQPDSHSDAEQWQIINTTTWRASDALTIKNIFSYGQLKTNLALDLFGTYFPVVPSGTPITRPDQVITFVPIRAQPGLNSNDQDTLTEELQFQGQAAGGRLQWQAGGYLEISNPMGRYGVQNPQFARCLDYDTFNCAAGASYSVSAAKTAYKSRAVYTQASFDLTEQLKLNAGLRYTWDDMRSQTQVQSVVVGSAGGGNLALRCVNPAAYRALGLPYNTPLPFSLQQSACLENFQQKSSAPTWMVGLDYKPVEEVLLYAKWSRGYRQGGTSPLGGEGYQTYGPEKVDTYEAGVKAAWRGSVPGSFNFTGFYNDFRDQQIQLGLQSTQTNPALNPTISIFNAGKSRIYGLETEFNITPVDGLRLSAAYSYTNSEITEYTQPTATPPYDIINPVKVGLELPFTTPHKFTASAFYTLPLSESVGRITIGGTYVRQAETFTIAGTNGTLPGWDIANASITWEGVGGMPVDIAAFVTNIWNEKYYTHVNDQANCGLDNVCSRSTNRGFVSYNLGEPRMYGLRVKYSFGQ